MCLGRGNIMVERKARKIPEPENWIERYNCYSFKKSSIRIGADYAMDGDGYQVRTMGYLADSKFPDLFEAKVAALVKARRIAQSIIKNIGEETDLLYKENPKKFMAVVERISKLNEVKWSRE